MDEVLQRLGQRDMEGVFGRHELPIPIRNPGVTLPYCRCSLAQAISRWYPSNSFSRAR